MTQKFSVPVLEEPSILTWMLLGEKLCTFQNDSTWSSFTLGQVSVHLVSSTVVAAAAADLQVLTLTSTSSLDFVIWGPPDLLVTRT